MLERLIRQIGMQRVLHSNQVYANSIDNKDADNSDDDGIDTEITGASRCTYSGDTKLVHCYVSYEDVHSKFVNWETLSMIQMIDFFLKYILH